MLAALMAANGDLESYRQLCYEVLNRFGRNTEPRLCNSVARDCLIVACTDVDLEAVNRLAETAVTLGVSNRAIGGSQFTKGLAELRQEHFASAVDWTDKVTDSGRSFPDAARGVQVCMVSALAHYRLKQMAQARAALAKGVELAQTKMPTLEGGDLGNDWQDWILANALLKEARALIEASSEKGGGSN